MRTRERQSSRYCNYHYLFYHLDSVLYLLAPPPFLSLSHTHIHALCLSLTHFLSHMHTLSTHPCSHFFHSLFSLPTALEPLVHYLLTPSNPLCTYQHNVLFVNVLYLQDARSKKGDTKRPPRVDLSPSLLVKHLAEEVRAM